MSKLKILRRLVQFSMAGFFILVPWLNANKFHSISGNFLSFNFFGIPLADPLAAVQILITSGSLGLKLLIGVTIPLILALLLGAVRSGFTSLDQSAANLRWTVS